MRAVKLGKTVAKRRLAGQVKIKRNARSGATTKWPTIRIVKYGGASSAGYRLLSFPQASQGDLTLR
jgi:hypothetical protein